MLTRRHMLTKAVAAGAVSATAARASAGEADYRDVLDQLVREVRALQRFEHLPGYGEMQAVRSARRTFLKQAGKFPDQIEMGLDVWESVLDFLVATQQPHEVQRRADGRYVVAYLGTWLVLKPELPETYVSPGI